MGRDGNLQGESYYYSMKSDIDTYRKKGRSSKRLHCDEEGKSLHQRRVQRAFNKAVKEAGIENFRFHDLRHCYASWNRQAGASLDDIAELLGQKDTRMAQRYSHITVQHLSKTVENVESFYEETFTKSLRSNKKGSTLMS